MPRPSRRLPSAGGEMAEPKGAWLLFYRVVRSIICGFCHLYWRMQVEGRANIPADGAFILSPLHRSNIDTPLMACITRRRMLFMGKDALWRQRWSAWFFTVMGGFPVNRQGADREALRRCEAALRRGAPVVIFPEGTRRSGPVVEDLFDGAAFVSLRTGAPILPVGVGGSARALPVGARFPRPVKVRIVIGLPIPPPPRPAAGAGGSRRQVHELTAQLRAELQRLSDEAGSCRLA